MQVDTFTGKICVLRCIHDQDGKECIQMRKKTHTTPLSRQEVEKLRKNYYIASVTANTVRFTEAFKELAYEKKILGVPIAETMRKCGIDPEILGASRVEGFSYTLNHCRQLKRTWKQSPFLQKQFPSKKCRLGITEIAFAAYKFPLSG